MADKPKTYAMQVQELKEQKEELLTTVAELERQISFIPELQEKISDLEAKLAGYADKSRDEGVNNKAQLTDAIQRAEQAELALRNRNSLLADFQAEKDGLLQQIEILENERLKNKGKDDKIILLGEELQRANLRVAAINQQIRDAQAEFDKDIKSLSNELRSVKADRSQLTQDYETLVEKYNAKVLEIENLKTEFTDKITLLWQENQELKTRILHYQSVLGNVQQAASGM